MKNMLLAALVATTSPAWAGTNDILVGLDSKIAFTDQGQTNVQPGTDKLLVLDVSNPALPKIRATLDLANSLLGPPTNLQITPDGRLGLIANSVVHTADGAGWKLVPDDRLFVVDLDAKPPKLIDTVTVGKQPSGLAISHDGKLVLIANRAGKSVSVLSIEGTSVKHLKDVDLGQEAAAIAITPDGKRALAVMNVVSKVAVLDISGQTVTYDKAQDITVGANPYNVDIAPNGKFAIVGGTGAGRDNADALTTIAVTGPHPHITSITTAGTGPEGMAISPDGKYLVTPLLLGTTGKKSDYFYGQHGQAVLLGLAADGTLKVDNRAVLGAVPEGVAFSRDSRYVYIGNYGDKTLQVFSITANTLQPHGLPITLPGQPASIRGVAR